MTKSLYILEILLKKSDFCINAQYSYRKEIVQDAEEEGEDNDKKEELETRVAIV